MRRSILSISAGLLSAALLSASAARGLEVDPYQAWLVEIPDSTEAVNAYVTSMLAGHLQVVNERREAPTRCAPVAISALEHLHHNVLGTRRAMAFLDKSPDVTGWKNGVGPTAVWRSYYRRLPPLYVSSISATLDLDGVRLSTDKIGHFFGAGRRYYRKYLRQIEAGIGREAAERAVVLYGIGKENGFLGKKIDGIFSHADLEANWQGFLFARDLCGSEQPYLVREDGAWRLARPVDLRPYLTPALDEGYNTNHFNRLAWLLVRSRLRAQCDVFSDPRVRERLRRYERHPRSRSQEIVEEFFEARDKNPQERHSPYRLCSERSPGRRENRDLDGEGGAGESGR